MKFQKAGFKTEDQADAEKKAKYGPTFNFRIAKRIDAPEVRTLWDLLVVDSEGQVLEVAVDADSLGACVDNLSAILEEAGY